MRHHSKVDPATKAGQGDPGVTSDRTLQVPHWRPSVTPSKTPHPLQVPWGQQDKQVYEATSVGTQQWVAAALPGWKRRAEREAA